MCIHIFFEVEDLIEKNIHTEVQNKEALADIEMAVLMECFMKWLPNTKKNEPYLSKRQQKIIMNISTINDKHSV